MYSRCILTLSLIAIAACATKREQTPQVRLERENAAGTSAGDSPQACVGPGPQAKHASAKNVNGGALMPCPSRSVTGFYRDGYCSTGPTDQGVHVVCAHVTDAFLNFSKAQGNDLVTQRPGFEGLRDGDAWCLCAARWQEASRVGCAPPVVLEATEERALGYVDERQLREHAERRLSQ